MRKKPQQARSRLVVQSLVEAGARVIAREGLEAATAARIADEAGVSVGSLYQYFDSKEDIYRSVLRQIGEGLKLIVGGQLGQLEGRDIGEFVRDLLNEVWGFLEADGQRYLQITRYWAQLDFTAVMNDLERQMNSVLAVYMMQRPRETPITDAPAKIYVLVNSVLFTIVRYISDPAPHVSREQIVETFSEVARILVGGPALPGSTQTAAAAAVAVAPTRRRRKS